MAELVGSFTQRAVNLVFHLVENAIDEALRVRIGEYFAQVDRLIDTHDWGNIVAVKELVNGKA